MGAEQSLEQADPMNASPFSRLLPKTGSRSDGVVVVSGPSSYSPGQTELDKLTKIPLFSPFIKSSVNLFGFDSSSIDGSTSSNLSASPSSGLSQTTPMLDSRAIAAISTRLQEHLRQCAEAVAFDQNALCTRMSEIDLASAASHSCLSERHRRYSRLSDQLTQMRDTCALAAKVKAGVEQTHRGLLELNNMLPADLRVAIPEMQPSVETESARSSRTVSNSNSIDAPRGSSFFETLTSSTSSSTSSHLQQADDRPSPNPASLTVSIKEEDDDKESTAADDKAANTDKAKDSENANETDS